MIHSIFVECRKWHDKTHGNTYYSNRIWVDGAVWKIQEMTYGYDTQYLWDAIKELRVEGVLSPEMVSPYDVRTAGIALYSADSSVKKSELFKKEVAA